MSTASFEQMAQGLASPEILGQIAQQVLDAETELTRQTGSRVELVQKVGRHTLEAGGKRMRPAFVALGAMATGLPYDRERAVKLGACMEMIHMATLIHDDVIDHAETRRGLATASASYGNAGAILGGDVLLAKAMSILAIDGDLEIIRAVSESVVEMAEGEVREVETRGIFDLELDDHFEILRMKTASFIECCCAIGARMAGGDEDAIFHLRSYGHHAGMAFQIADDLLDYRGDTSKTGKPLATDFREGCATLPLILLRSKLSEEEQTVARRKFGNGVSDDELRMIIGWMDARGAFAEAEWMALQHLSSALEHANALPDTPTRELLTKVAEYIVRRDL